MKRFFEIFEYSGMHLRTDHFKLGVSLEALCARNLKMSYYWNISWA